MTRRRDVAEARLPESERVVIVSYGFRGRASLRIIEGGKKTGSCKISSPTGAFDLLAVAPDASLASVRWTDQTEAGLVLVELAEPRQRAEWETRQTNWLEGPAWTPDSKLLVLVENPVGAGPWWAAQEPGEADDDDRSPGGAFSPGSVVAVDRELRERYRRRIEVELPAGWFPGSGADHGLGPPIVVESNEVSVRVPGEGNRRLRLRGL